MNEDPLNFLQNCTKEDIMTFLKWMHDNYRIKKVIFSRIQEDLFYALPTLWILPLPRMDDSGCKLPFLCFLLLTPQPGQVPWCTLDGVRKESEATVLARMMKRRTR